MPLMHRRHGTHHVRDAAEQELQTDTMRFVAILALALMAVFALVRGVPLRPPTASVAEADKPMSKTMDTPRAEPTAPVRSSRRAFVPDPPPEGSRRDHTTRAETPPPPTGSRLTDTSSDTSPPPASMRHVPRALDPDPAPPAKRPGGFTLRFASARALTHLVATGRVRMYARTPHGRFRQVEIIGARIRLREGPGPRAYHEMETSTVPGTFLMAAGDDDRLVWGVTLPQDLEQRIAAFIRSRDSGVIEIDAAGHVRLREGPHE